MTKSQVKVKVSAIVVRTIWFNPWSICQMYYFTLSVTYYANTGCIISIVLLSSKCLTNIEFTF